MFMLRVVIELKRQKMMKLADRYGYSASQTVKCSQELDKLINIHQKAKGKKLRMVN